MKKPSQLRLFLIMSTIACILILIIYAIFSFTYIKTSLYEDGLDIIDLIFTLIFFSIGIYIFRFNTILNPIQVKREDIIIIRNNISSMIIKPKGKRRKLFILKRFSDAVYIDIILNNTTIKSEIILEKENTKILQGNPRLKYFIRLGTVFFIFCLTIMLFFLLAITLSGQLDLISILCFSAFILVDLFLLWSYTFRFILKIEIKPDKIIFYALWHKTEVTREDDISFNYGTNSFKIYIKYKNGRKKKISIDSNFDNGQLELIKDFIYNR